MKYLLISFSFLLIISCKSIDVVKGLEKESVAAETIKNPYFSDINKDYVYKAKITAGKNNFGGLLIIKKIKNAYHRVVFTTEFGNKIFDFEFLNNEFKVNYVLDKLDKKLILNALKKDYQLLVKELYLSETQFNLENGLVHKVKFNKKDNYFVFDNNNELSKTIMASKRKEKLTIFFSDIKENVANSIKMEHHNFKMLTLLSFIND